MFKNSMQKNLESIVFVLFSIEYMSKKDEQIITSSF